MVRFWGVLGVAAALATLGPVGRACAEPGLGNKVYSPFVRSGVTEVEVRSGILQGGTLNGEAGTVVELEQGLNERVSLAIVAEFEHHAGEESKLDSLGIESVVYLGQIPGLGVDVGGYFEYEQRIHNESGVLEGKLLLARDFGPVHGLLNVIARQALTDRPGEGATAFSYAAQATVDVTPRLVPHLALGVQAFGDLGDSRHAGGRQAHYLGPVAQWTFKPHGFPGELEFEAAWLAPLGTARDETNQQFRFVVEWEKRF